MYQYFLSHLLYTDFKVTDKVALNSMNYDDTEGMDFGSENPHTSVISD